MGVSWTIMRGRFHAGVVAHMTPSPACTAWNWTQKYGGQQAVNVGTFTCQAVYEAAVS
jgi:hypothetical protein